MSEFKAGARVRVKPEAVIFHEDDDNRNVGVLKDNPNTVHPIFQWYAEPDKGYSFPANESELELIEVEPYQYDIMHVTYQWYDAREYDPDYKVDIAYHVLGTDIWFRSPDGIGRYFYGSYADLNNDVPLD